MNVIRWSRLIEPRVARFSRRNVVASCSQSRIILPSLAASFFRNYSQQLRVQPTSSIQIKPKVKARRKQKPLLAKSDEKAGFWNAIAISTAEEYNLEGIIQYFSAHRDYVLSNRYDDASNAVHVVVASKVDTEKGELFVFREGSFVAWNIPDSNVENLLQVLSNFEIKPYDCAIVKEEIEIMPYTFSTNRPKLEWEFPNGNHLNVKSMTSKRPNAKYCVPNGTDNNEELRIDTRIYPLGKGSSLQNGNIYLTSIEDASIYHRYTFSNGMALSVKLGIWEGLLDRYIDSIEPVTMDLKAGNRIKLSRKNLLKKTGELFALKHSINLSSDLLDLPDYYWEREELENMYLRTCRYFNIPKRTQVINEKLSHCIELVDLVNSQLSDQHHTRLELMIIALIMIEVGFEVIHFLSR